MKSKTSCYEPALGRMGLRRFAPAFALYAVALFLLTTNLLGREQSTAWIYREITYFCCTMAPINLAYAAVLAQLLLGDLYTTRLSFGLRAMPMTTGGWYGTQIILGILGSLIPNALNAGLMLLYLEEYKIVAFWWLLSSQLQFLCFYGIAVLCAVCAGNRIGMLILDTIVNFANLFVSWLISQLYVPLVYGLRASGRDSGMYSPLSPIYSMTSASIFNVELKSVPDLSVSEYTDGPVAAYATTEKVDKLYLTDQLWTLLIWAAVGIAAIWLGSRLLRKVKAESAGELLAFPRLEPVILLLVTLGVGTAFHIASDIFASEMTYLLLAVGLVIGYFGCLMLLRRQVNVFTKKAFVPLLGIFAAVFLSLTLTGLDVMNVRDRIPEAGQVESVTLDSPQNMHFSTPITEKSQIETVIGIHEAALREGNAVIEGQPLLRRIFADKQDERLFEVQDLERCGQIILKYTMKDGSTLRREYFLKNTSSAAPAVRQILSRPETVFTTGRTIGKTSLLDEDGSFTTFLKDLKVVQFTCYCGDDEFSSFHQFNITQQDQQQSLLNALKADCEAGTMAQVWFLRPTDRADQISFYYEEITPNYGPRTTGFSLEISPESENTFRWLTENGYHQALAD